MDAKTIILGISAAAAFIALYYNSLINKRKSTVELLLNQRNDDNLIKARKVVSGVEPDVALQIMEAEPGVEPRSTDLQSAA